MLADGVPSWLSTGSSIWMVSPLKIRCQPQKQMKMEKEIYKCLNGETSWKPYRSSMKTKSKSCEDISFNRMILQGLPIFTAGQPNMLPPLPHQKKPKHLQSLSQNVP